MNASQALGTLKLLEENTIEFKNVVEIVALCAKKKISDSSCYGGK